MTYRKTYQFSNIRTYSYEDKFIIVYYEGTREAPPEDMPLEQAYRLIDLSRDIVKIYKGTKE